MTRELTALTLLSFALSACAANAPEPAVAETPETDTVKKKKSAKKKKADETTVEVSLESGPRIDRELGDFFVYRFGGSFTDQQVTMTEQVVAIDDGLLVVDFVLEEGETMTALRVRMKPDGNEVVRVSKLGAEGEMAAEIADYEAMIAKTQFIPDSNDEVVGTDASTCLIATKEVECDVATYIVSVGDKEAMLSVKTSKEIPGRDIGGEIIGPDGKTVYSARLIDHGNEAPVTDALARGDLKRYTPDSL